MAPRSPRRDPEARMPLAQHLIELRKRLTRGALAIIAGTVGGWFLYDLVWPLISNPITQIAAAQGADDQQVAKIALNYTGITGAFDVRLQIAIAVGVEDLDGEELAVLRGVVLEFGDRDVIADARLHVRLDDGLDGARHRDPAVLEQDAVVAELAQRPHVVADEQDGPAVPRGDVAHLPEAFLLEGVIADREHLVDDQDLRLEVRRHRERQADEHAAGVTFYRRIDEAADFREFHDLVELCCDLRPAHAHDRAI